MIDYTKEQTHDTPVLYINLSIKPPSSIITLSTTLSDEMKLSTTRQRHALKIVLSNLARKASSRWGVGFQSHCAEPKHKNPSNIGTRLLSQTFKTLQDFGYVRLHVGVWSGRSESGVGECSRAYPTQKLQALISATTEQACLFTHYDTDVPVIVRNKDKTEKVLNLDNPTVNKVVKTMREVNSVLAGTQVTLDGRDVSNQYVRIFNGSLKKGGRLYTTGYGVQQIKSKDRLGLKIGGDGVVEVDISACHLVIAGILSGVNISELNPYEHILTSSNIEVNGVNLGVVKAGVMRMLNCNGLQACATAIQKVLKVDIVGSSFKRATDVLIAVETAYPFMESYVDQHDSGLMLMQYDSEIVLSVIKKLSASGIACCAVHDSFVVQKEYVDDLCCAILDSFVDVFELKGKTSIPVKVLTQEEETRILLSVEQDVS